MVCLCQDQFLYAYMDFILVIELYINYLNKRIAELVGVDLSDVLSAD